MSLLLGLSLREANQRNLFPEWMSDPNEETSNPGHITNLAKEFMVGGMTIAGNEFFEAVFRSALEAMTKGEEKVRILSSSSSSSSSEDEEEDQLLSYMTTEDKEDKKQSV